jgi:hypothetical protein
MKVTITINYRGHEAEIELDDCPEDMTHERLIEDFIGEMQLTIKDSEGNELPSEWVEEGENA